MPCEFVLRDASVAIRVKPRNLFGCQDASSIARREMTVAVSIEPSKPSVMNCGYPARLSGCGWSIASCAFVPFVVKLSAVKVWSARRAPVAEPFYLFSRICALVREGGMRNRSSLRRRRSCPGIVP